MIQAPKRRWFRFSLRTLFVVVTVFACWLGYSANWIRQRHAVLSQCLWAMEFEETDRFEVDGPPQTSPPGLLWLFGERGYVNMCLEFRADQDRYLTTAEEDEVRRAKRLFPEAVKITGLAGPGRARR